MKKLKTSTSVLIALIVSAVLLAVVMYVTMPEPIAEAVKTRHSLMLSGNFHCFDGETAEGFASRRNPEGYGRTGGRGRASFRSGFGRRFPVPFTGIILLAFIVFMIFRHKPHGRRDHSRDILDELFASGKITEEEYGRRKIVLEEEKEY